MANAAPQTAISNATGVNLRRCSWCLVLVFAAAVSGCGQTGPLYLPKEQPPEETTES